MGEKDHVPSCTYAMVESKIKMDGENHGIEGKGMRSGDGGITEVT